MLMENSRCFAKLSHLKQHDCTLQLHRLAKTYELAALTLMSSYFNLAQHQLAPDGAVQRVMARNFFSPITTHSWFAK